MSNPPATVSSNTNSTGQQQAQALTTPPPQVNVIIAAERAHNQSQWNHYNIDALTINMNSLALNCPLDNSLSLPARNIPFNSPLLSLPPEILHLILQYLPISTLTTFRLLSSYARQLVSADPLYSPVYDNAASCLRAILATGIGPHITLLQLHAALNTPSCGICGKYGDFFNLLTTQRVCHACFATSPTQPYQASPRETGLLPTIVSMAKSTYGLSPSTISSLPTVKSIPGLYGRERSNIRHQRLKLCLPSTARALGIAQHGRAAKMKEFVEARNREIDEQQRKKWDRSDWETGGMVIGRFTPDPRDFDRGWDNPWRHMVVVRFPWLRKDSGEVIWGRYCERCREKAGDDKEGERRWNVRWSREELREHLKVCL